MTRQQLSAKLAKVRLFLCDVDGILTDASVYMGEAGEIKRFHIRDGLGLRLLQHHGIKVGWISNRPSPATQARADDLKVDYLYQGIDNKVAAAEKMLATAGVAWNQVSFMGDDIVDLGLLRRAGVSLTVPDAVAEAKRYADYVTKNQGGQGAVREAVELILKAQKKWEPMIQQML